MELTIRRANEQDAAGIRAVAQTRWVSKDSKEITGLMGYRIPDEEKYKFRTSRGIFFVAEETEKNKIVGFIDAYPDELLKEIFPGDPLVRYVTEIERERFSFDNTCAILTEYERTGLSGRLFDAIRNNLNPECRAVWRTIVHKPTMNIKSVASSGKLGFKFQMERDEFGFTFGLYRLTI